MVKTLLRSLYEKILKITIEVRLIGSYGLEIERMMNINYKTIAKKVNPMATQLPLHSKVHMKKVEEEPTLRKTIQIGHNFIKETLIKLKIRGDEFLKEPKKKRFQIMISKYVKVFASSLDEIRCINPKVIAPMVIFYCSTSTLEFKINSYVKALLSKLINLLKKITNRDI